jgi:hypothetical protein
VGGIIIAEWPHDWTANPEFPDFTRTIRAPDVHHTSGNVEQEVLTSMVEVVHADRD